MLTPLESISLAGDRAKQNDDAFGFAYGNAWIIDGATDLHDAPLTGAASDASWIAHTANAALHAYAYPELDSHAGLTKLLRTIVDEQIAPHFAQLIGARPIEAWQRPIASILMITETAAGLAGIDLGDSRIFAVDADGAVHIAGGAEGARDAEARAAATQTDADKPLLQRTATIDKLRQGRAKFNQPGAPWTLSLDPNCADHARLWSFALKRPAYLLLMTDGFAVLADQYGAYEPAALVRAALDKGLQELGREVRAIETADAGGALHPRFKRSDDATALLLRLD